MKKTLRDLVKAAGSYMGIRIARVDKNGRIRYSVSTVKQVQAAVKNLKREVASGSWATK